MKKIFFLGFLFVSLWSAKAQDTFSIVAVDSTTGEVGSCGASCVNGSIIISDLFPNIGAIHTQALWMSANQYYARLMMEAGHSPQEIIDSLVANDIQNDPSVRQYGIVKLNGGNPQSAAFTGSNCFDYKFHRTGPGYSIQGNILNDSSVIDSIESGFLKTTGTLADKLMAALQGANRPGADSRCLSDSTSSKSSFIRVALPGDSNCFFLDLNVQSTPIGVEPIDSLQTLFDSLKNNCNLLKANLNNNWDTTDIVNRDGRISFSILNGGFESCFYWDFGDGTNESSLTSVSHYYTTPGVYTASLIVWNYGCSDTAYQQIVVLNDINNPDQIKELQGEAIQISPNPAENTVKISLNDKLDFYKLEILTLDGREVFSANLSPSTKNYYWDCRYRKGVFVIKLFSQEGIHSQKLIVE